MERQRQFENLRSLFAGESGIRVAYLFGSRARGDARSDSDIDIGIDCDSPMTFEELDELAARIQEILDVGEVDLVAIGDQAPELAFRIIVEGQLIYCVSEYERVELEANIATRFGDYLPVLERQRQALIEGADHDRAVRRYRKALGETRRLLEQIGAPGRQTSQ